MLQRPALVQPWQHQPSLIAWPTPAHAMLRVQHRRLLHSAGIRALPSKHQQLQACMQSELRTDGGIICSTAANTSSQQGRPARMHPGSLAACSPSSNGGVRSCTCGPAFAPVRMQRRSRRQQIMQPVATAAADMGGSDDYALPSVASFTSKIRRRLTTEYDAELFALALPALAAMVLDPIMNIIDTAMVGHLGAQQLGAVSLGSLCISFSVMLFSFLMFLTTPRVAAAVVSGNRAQVSSQAAMGVWLAAGLGLAVALGMFTAAPAIVGVLRPPDAVLAQHAINYIKVRSLGILGILLVFVASGTFRGMKDTRTPLLAAGCATTCKFLLNLLFIYGLQWGVVGSGLASSLANWVSAAVLLGLLMRSGSLRVQELRVPPALHDVLPLLRAGVVLSGRIVITFGCIMYGSTLTVRTGAINQSAFEILRQVWLVSMQVFECLNVATQSMAATLLGAGDRASARAVLLRALTLSTGVGAVAGAVLWAARQPLVGLFSSEAAVAATALGALPLICGLLPLDAAASIMDGGLMAASQTDLLSVVQVTGSLVQFAALSWLVANGAVSVLSVWAVLKSLSLFRAAGGAMVHFASPWSAYQHQPATNAAGPSGKASW